MNDDVVVSNLTEIDWGNLIKRIDNAQVTPFLGAGMSSEKIPMGKEIAERLAADHNYPLSDKHDLIKVSQYVSLIANSSTPKEFLADIIKKADYPDFKASHEPHMALARLPLPLYITTNYDDFMFQALKNTPGKEPQIFINGWHDTQFASKNHADINPTLTHPVVYHFHGHKDYLETMVLTEDDYLDFLVRVSRDQTLIPPRIQQAIGGTSLLFIGYSLSDTNFRVIFRGLVEAKRTAKKVSVTVQINPGQQKVADYLKSYFGAAGVKVYWGTADRFVVELVRRWEAAKK